MKKFKLITVFLVFCSLTAASQELRTTPKKMPYYDMIEWPNQGVLIFGKDPKGNTLQQEITLINDLGEVKWQEQYMPQVSAPKIILSEYSNYLYFLDQLQPDNAGKIYYNQTNLSGYIRKGSIYFPPIFRTVADVDYNSTELIDIISATDDLIFHFRLKDKKNKSYQDVLVFLNHYSLKTFIAKVPGIYPFEKIDSGERSLVYFAGSKEDENYFAHHTIKDKKKGYDVLVFDKKGNFTGSRFFESPDDKIETTKRLAVYPSGAFYAKASTHTAKGQLFYFNNEWFLAGRKGATFSLWKYEGNKPSLLISNHAIDVKKNPEHEMGVTQLKDHFIILVNSDVTNSVLSFSKNGQLVKQQQLSSEYGLANLSRYLKNADDVNFLYLFNEIWYSTPKLSFGSELIPVIFQK